MPGFCDIHHHILYGLDQDGPQSFEDMQAMLHAAVEDKTDIIIATPHVTPGIDYFDWLLYEERLDEANFYCQSAGLPLRVYAGAELLWTEQTPEMLQAGRVPSLAGSRYVLLEFLPKEENEIIKRAVTRLNEAGYIPILAHAERYVKMIRRLSFVDALKRDGKVFYQINNESILEPRGFFVKKFINHLVRTDQLDALASDAHNVGLRPTNMTQAYKKIREINGQFEFFRMKRKIMAGYLHKSKTKAVRRAL